MDAPTPTYPIAYSSDPGVKLLKAAGPAPHALDGTPARLPLPQQRMWRINPECRFWRVPA
jgi:hypothetical protein